MVPVIATRMYDYVWENSKQDETFSKSILVKNTNR